MWRPLWIMATLAAFAPAVGCADIAYDAQERTISVTGFSQEAMGTLEDVRQADAQGQWGVVGYDEPTGTFTVSVHLCIGTDDGSSTWFRIGTAERPGEVLVIKGDLRVHQPKALEGYR